MIGPHADERELAALARRSAQHPERWIAQDVVRLSTVPTVTGDGSLHRATSTCGPSRSSGAHRHRPRRAHARGTEEGSLIVNSSRGGGAKDTWVLENGEEADRAAGVSIADTMPPALPDLRYGLGAISSSSNNNNNRRQAAS